MTELTRKAIRESFLKLLDERPVHKITIRDIVQDCGINRNTFYYHYRDLPALIEEIFIDEADEIIRQFPGISSIEECLEAVVNTALSRKRAVLHLYQSSGREVYEQSLWRVCEHVVTAFICSALPDLNENDRDILIRFYKCECFGQAAAWLNDGMRYDILADFRRLCALKKGMAAELIYREKTGQTGRHV